MSVQNSNDILCNKTGICKNTIGYFNCECVEGYTSDLNSNLCIGKAYLRLLASFNLANDFMVLDINECEYETCTSVLNTSCVAFGMCRNLPGAFICDCFEGFEFDIIRRQCTGTSAFPV